MNVYTHAAILIYFILSIINSIIAFISVHNELKAGDEKRINELATLWVEFGFILTSWVLFVFIAITYRPFAVDPDHESQRNRRERRKLRV